MSKPVLQLEGKVMSKQNRSAAVMQQRSEPHDSLDDFPTPPWATRALCEFLQAQGHLLTRCIVREPAANRGHMVKPLLEYFGSVEASDVHDYGAGYEVQDYLFPFPLAPVHWTITNPPFRLALDSSTNGVAMIVRSAFLEGQERYTELFRDSPPSYVLQFSERCGMFKGRLRQLGEKYVDDDGVERSAATATAYSWLVWLNTQDADKHDTRLRWIPPCRKQLERPGDYPPEPTA